MCDACVMGAVAARLGRRGALAAIAAGAAAFRLSASPAPPVRVAGRGAGAPGGARFPRG